MKLALTKKLVEDFKLVKKPVALSPDGDIIFQDNTTAKTPYFVFDAAPGAPLGFGLKVANKKTFVIQKKVSGKTFRATVGSVAEFMGQKDGLDKAREKAAGMGAEMRQKQINPNVAARKILASEKTLGMAFDEYELHLSTRKKRPAKPNTLKVYRRCARKFSALRDIKIRALDTDDIVKLFHAGSDHETSNEQAFRTAYTVVRYCIETEALQAAIMNRPALLTANPFAIIKHEDLYRTRAEIERKRREGFVRSPLSPSVTLGKFLEALWAKRLSRQNKTGCDYLLLTLLTGARRSECANLQWAEMLTEQERRTRSWVDIKEGKVFFYMTKNQQDHLLPLGPCALELLRRTQAEEAENLGDPTSTFASRKWVFPARNKKNQAGHYKDAQDLLARIREIADIPVLTRHDLRRSFGAVLDELEVPDGIGKRFMNHAQAETHNRYRTAEWTLMQTWMTKIEEAILIRGANVWNSLKPADKSPIASQPLPEVPKDKPRTGRPKKTETVDDADVTGDEAAA
jgi:integrase